MSGTVILYESIPYVFIPINTRPQPFVPSSSVSSSNIYPSTHLLHPLPPPPRHYQNHHWIMPIILVSNSGWNPHQRWKSWWLRVSFDMIALLHWFRYCDSSYSARAIAIEIREKELVAKITQRTLFCATFPTYIPCTLLDSIEIQELADLNSHRSPPEGKKRRRTILIFWNTYSVSGWHTTIFHKARKSLITDTSSQVYFPEGSHQLGDECIVLLTECTFKLRLLRRL